MVDFQYKSFIIEYLINEEIVLNNYIIEQIQCVKEVKMNWANHKSNDIRKFIITKRKNRKKSDSNKKDKDDRVGNEILYNTDIDSK